MFQLGLFYINAVEIFYGFSRSHENWQLDEVVFIIPSVGSICLAIFSRRRWKDVSRLLKEANSDPLTGLFNRRKGWDIIEKEMKRSKRYLRPLSLIMFDLDHFKRVNDTFGHLSGDKVLKAASAVTKGSIRKTDSLVRWGGDEFLVICPETEFLGAWQLAERIRIDMLNFQPPGLPGVTASFGVSQMQGSDDFFTLIKSVDKCLYEAKAKGRNLVV